MYNENSKKIKQKAMVFGGILGEVMKEVSFKLGLAGLTGFRHTRTEAGNSRRMQECSQKSRDRKK